MVFSRFLCDDGVRLPDMPVKAEHLVMPDASCDLTGRPETADLVWLTHRAAEVLGLVFDEVARQHGLADLRDWLVLTLAGDGTHRTQLEIALQLGIDKSTMVLILDRLERSGLIRRTSSERDRRVRIPEATDAGIKVHRLVDDARNAAVEGVLTGVSRKERATLRSVLWHIATQP